MTDGVQYIGKFLITLGVVVIAVGGLLLLSAKIPWLGRLPGDLLIQKKNFTFLFSIGYEFIVELAVDPYLLVPQA